MSDDDNPLTRAVAEIEADNSPVERTARRLRAQIAKEMGTPQGKVTAAVIAAFAQKEMEQAAAADAPPLGAVMDTGYICIAEDKIETGHSLVVAQHYYSEEHVARKAYAKWDHTAYASNSAEGEAEIIQFANTGVLEGDDWRLRIVPVNLVVTEEN